MAGVGYDFYDTEIQGLQALKDGAEVVIRVRDRENLESKAVRAVVSRSPENLQDAEKLYIYGRLGVPISEEWFIEIIDELGDEALGTAAEVAAQLDPEMGLKSTEAFKTGRRKST